MVQFWTRISSKLEPAPPVDSKPMPPVFFEVASVPNWPLTLWTFNPTRWMWWETPVAITRTPRRVPAVDAMLETSRLLMSQYCCPESNTASVAPPPSMWGMAPVPYSSMVIVFPKAPLPPGCNVPVQVQPAMNDIESPGANCLALTGASVFHAVDWDVPGFPSLPALQSTKYEVAPASGERQRTASKA